MKYGIMMDGTVDISGTDQMNIVSRFVDKHGNIQERLLGLEVITSGKGIDLWKLLVGKLENLKLDIGGLIGLSLDGASANTSENLGVVKYYHDAVPEGYFVWGIAHQQNLVITPVLSEIKDPRNLMGILQETCSFFNGSTRRMDIWKKWVKTHSAGSKKLSRLVKLGTTRWWSAYKAISRITDDPRCYFILLGALWELSTSAQSTAATKRQSDSLLTSYLRFNTLLTAKVLKKILATFDPVTKYLQTCGMYLNQAVKMVEFENKILIEDRSKFGEMLPEVNAFRQEVQNLVDEDSNEDFDVVLEEALPTMTISRKKKRFFREAADERMTTESDPQEHYRINTFLPVVDRLSAEISTRFSEKNTELYSELAWLNPSSYASLNETSVFSMCHLAQMANVEEKDLKQELLHFARCHKHLGENILPTEKEGNESDDETHNMSDMGLQCCKGNCSQCLICVYKLLMQYRFHCRSYNKLYRCIRMALTLPCTVVSCERVFSKMRYVKNRPRSLLGHDLLAALLLCNVEVDILKAIDHESVYQKLANMSTGMKAMLIYP